MSVPKRVPSGLFSYRHNPDGTWDSICLLCYMTAASTPREDELQALERLHICSPMGASETVLRDTLMTLRDLGSPRRSHLKFGRSSLRYWSASNWRLILFLPTPE
jgi:hypothetical protein